MEAVGAEEVLAGRHPVLEALKAGRPVYKLLLAEGAAGGSLAEIQARARAAGAVLQVVPKARLNVLCGPGHQGVAALVAVRAYADLDEVVQRDTGQAPLLVLLDEVTDPHNVGAILRTAEATGVQGLVVPKRRSAPLTGAVAKAAAGAVEYVPVARVGNLVQSMERLKQFGYWLIGADVDGQQLYTEADYRGPTAFVIGAEGRGLSRLVKDRCDMLVRLPMRGQLQSLNASVAAGVLL
ncbi:MAG: 23S rRNA (guanosine(2251)-2'-O)-methyltransferase RlmB, partial [Alicyclobacillus sp.]|nr:23S rRNA (guanosine(2251)-2'-O)-methyltransferase RlmB [Alicyclobacillus sp.]